MKRTYTICIISRPCWIGSSPESILWWLNRWVYALYVWVCACTRSMFNCVHTVHSSHTFLCVSDCFQTNKNYWNHRQFEARDFVAAIQFNGTLECKHEFFFRRYYCCLLFLVELMRDFCRFVLYHHLLDFLFSYFFTSHCHLTPSIFAYLFSSLPSSS